MDVHGRHFLIPSFSISVIICVGSKLVHLPADREPLGSYFRVISDGAVLLLHFIYLGSSIDSFLARPNDAYQLLLDTLGFPLACVYAYIQFWSSVVGNHYMSVCAADIVLEYATVLLTAQQYGSPFLAWRRWTALLATVLLTLLNCYSIRWTTTTFAIYMKSLFMSFWMAKIWINLTSIQAAVVSAGQDFVLIMCLTFAVIALLVAVKEFDCFPRDVVSANQTVLLPLYEQLVGVSIPELPVIAACYYSGSLNSFFLTPEPFIKAAQNGQLPFAVSLCQEKTNSPIVLLLLKSVITAIAVGYLSDDLLLLGSTWNCLLIAAAVLFDIATLRANYVQLKCGGNSRLQTVAMCVLHAGFQLANFGWIYHRVTGFGDIARMLLFIASVTIVAFKMVQSDTFVEICCSRLKLTCYPKMGLMTDDVKKPNDACVDSLA